MSIRLGVVGSRDFFPLFLIHDYLHSKDVAGELDCIVSGGARGVDRAAEEWGKANGVPVVSFRVFDRKDGWFNIERWTFDATGQATEDSPHRIMPPRGQAYRSFAAAAFVRNGYIVEFADGVVAFWDGRSRGTRDSISRAREAGNLLDIIRA